MTTTTNDAAEIICTMEAVWTGSDILQITSAVVSIDDIINQIKAIMNTALGEDTARITLQGALSAVHPVMRVPENEGEKMVRTIPCKTVFEDGQYVYTRRFNTRELKKRTRCMGCGGKGHWFRDRERCMKLMDHKTRRERSSKNTVEMPEAAISVVMTTAQRKRCQRVHYHIFSASGSVNVKTDPNPVVDEEPSTSTGGVEDSI